MSRWSSGAMAMNDRERVLAAIQAHPEGITTWEIVAAIWPDAPPWRIPTLMGGTHHDATKLAHWGQVYGTPERRRTRQGQHQVQTVWRPRE